MLVRVEVRTAQGVLLNLPLDDMSSGYVVEEITGLDPVKATLVSSSFANLDGAQYHSSRREPRNIKMRLGFEADYVATTVDDLRNHIYNFFMPKSLVSFRFFKLNGDSFDIEGRVESCESALFTQEPMVDISTMCFDPDFYKPEELVVTQDTTPNTVGAGDFTINYEGTVETGFVFKLLVNRALPQFTIYQTPPDGTLRTLAFTQPLQAGDVLTISTIQGAKRVTRLRAGVETSLLFGMTPQSNWLEFQPGPNVFRVHAEGALIPFEIRRINKYGGL